MAVIDSGYSGYKNQFINGIKITKCVDGFHYDADYSDIIGHGTIVTNLLLSYVNIPVNIFTINIFDNNLNVDIDLLIEALNYCEKELNCDIIQISAGILYTNSGMKSVIDRLTNSNTIVIAAFDNEKAVSYPAAYTNVIGVDTSNDIIEKNSYYIIDGDGVIDIRISNNYYRTIDINDKNTIVHGSSFACSYISSIIVNSNIKKMGKKRCIQLLKENALQVFQSPNPSSNKIEQMMIKNAIAFPFNKEMHALANFEHTIDYRISGYYDIRQKGICGKKISDVFPYMSNNKQILDYNTIIWDEDFDTFICGHVQEISKILGVDVLDIIMSKCFEYKKQLICFDNPISHIHKYPELRIWFPFKDQRFVPQNRYGKLRSPKTPILGVFGTSSRQGKMSIQLMLRDGLKKIGVNVKSIGSEPESELLGFEYSYAFGYNSIDFLQPHEMILVLNEAIYTLENTNCDIIIVGSQSGTVSHQLRSLDMIPLKQYYFLLGTQPDSIILVVNACDTIEYIMRTINFIKSAVNAEILCIVVSNINNGEKGITINSIDYLRDFFKLPVMEFENLDVNNLLRMVMEFYE